MTRAFINSASGPIEPATSQTTHPDTSKTGLEPASPERIPPGTFKTGMEPAASFNYARQRESIMEKAATSFSAWHGLGSHSPGLPSKDHQDTNRGEEQLRSKDIRMASNTSDGLEQLLEASIRVDEITTGITFQ